MMTGWSFKDCNRWMKFTFRHSLSIARTEVLPCGWTKSLHRLDEVSCSSTRNSQKGAFGSGLWGSFVLEPAPRGELSFQAGRNDGAPPNMGKDELRSMNGIQVLSHGWSFGRRATKLWDESWTCSRWMKFKRMQWPSKIYMTTTN